MSKKKKNKNHKKKLKLLIKQNGQCYWCGCAMVLVSSPFKGQRTKSDYFSNEITLDHLYDKYDERRTTTTNGPVVGACNRCNCWRGYWSQRWAIESGLEQERIDAKKKMVIAELLSA